MVLFSAGLKLFVSLNLTEILSIIPVLAEDDERLKRTDELKKRSGYIIYRKQNVLNYIMNHGNVWFRNGMPRRAATSVCANLNS